MAQTVEVIAISRSQNVRVGTQKVPSIAGHFGDSVAAVTVDLTDPKARRDLQHHLALGAVIAFNYVTS